MDLLKQIFPFSFKERTVNQLVVSIILYVVADVVVGIACKLIGIIPLIGGLVAWILGTVVGAYTLIGIVLAVLHHFSIIE